MEATVPSLKALRKAQNLSERELALAAGIARETLRSCEADPNQSKLTNLEKIASALGHHVLIEFVPETPANSDLSIVAVSLAVTRDGFDSWKIHFMNFVDEFRRSRDVRLILLPPVSTLDVKLLALLASITAQLCHDAEISTPSWARREYFLDRPWFVAGMESLKASALLESAPEFRKNNIFVQENFLWRA
jgi:transcriptional regulator with XRE-family HTH domain